MEDGRISEAKARAYWGNAEATNNGVLGGFGHLSTLDARDSKKFLEKLAKDLGVTLPLDLALDVGAGVGRVTEEVLIHYFNHVDLVEQNSTFLAKACERLENSEKLGDLFCKNVQDIAASDLLKHKQYDVIWIQWVLNYVTDTQLEEFLVACHQYLKPTGILVIKENVTRHSSGDLYLDDVYDDEDGSVTRSDTHFEHIFKQSGYRCISTAFQKSFPTAIFPVKMTALSPCK